MRRLQAGDHCFAPDRRVREIVRTRIAALRRSEMVKAAELRHTGFTRINLP